MSSKVITTVIVALVVGPFAYTGYTDAVNIKQNLQKQNEHIQTLSTEYKKLDTELGKTKETKQKTQAEVDQLEQQTQSAASERQKLEAELGAN